MKAKGWDRFTMDSHTKLWKKLDAKNPGRAAPLIYWPTWSCTGKALMGADEAATLDALNGLREIRDELPALRFSKNNRRDGSLGRLESDTAREHRRDQAADGCDCGLRPIRSWLLTDFPRRVFLHGQDPSLMGHLVRNVAHGGARQTPNQRSPPSRLPTRLRARLGRRLPRASVTSNRSHFRSKGLNEIAPNNRRDVTVGKASSTQCRAVDPAISGVRAIKTIPSPSKRYASGQSCRCVRPRFE
jgi:hypothetical protein